MASFEDSHKLHAILTNISVMLKAHKMTFIFIAKYGLVMNHNKKQDFHGR
jgi:hypothetical protein